MWPGSKENGYVYILYIPSVLSHGGCQENKQYIITELSNFSTKSMIYDLDTLYIHANLFVPKNRIFSLLLFRDRT